METWRFITQKHVFKHIQNSSFHLWLRPSKKDVLLIIAIAIISCIYLSKLENNSKENSIRDQEEYLINTVNCQIPKMNPLNADVRPHFKKLKYVKCSENGLLTYISKKGQEANLKINQNLLRHYSYFKISCCYSNISRIDDNNLSLSDCELFETEVRLYHPLVLVKCTTFNFIEVYSNVHVVFDKEAVERNEFSVVLVGIDSVSKLNLARSMPKTTKLLEAYNFVNLKGYTKIADNTFPNLMAILSGKDRKQIEYECTPITKRMDDCDILWKVFKQFGYVTAYAEDETSIGTFNHNMVGFEAPPTDFYFRPYLLSAETMLKTKFGMSYCTGPESNGERVLNLVRDFVAIKAPKFGLFWMNSFSHNALNAVSSMDEKIEEFILGIYGYLDRTILIFFSDHGFRFGKLRHTYTGWLEERLPFFYIYIPETFRQLYPEKYKNLLLNGDRLTTPFDIYMTLQDILGLSQPSRACPKCHSLFAEVSENRTCGDAAIAEHWCVCKGHSYVDPKSDKVQEVAELLVDKLNKLVGSFSDGSRCSRYLLESVVSAGKSHSGTYLVLVETVPKAVFEATIDYDKSTILGDISRVDRYAKHSYCVEHSSLRKYCYCASALNIFKRYLDLR